jgi:hypothetical protein
MKHIPTYYKALEEIVGSENLTGGFTDGPMSEIGFAEGIDKPTEEEVQTKLASMISEWDAQAYSRSRQIEYPSIAELTVALYDTDDKAAIETKRAAVKTKYPKPS